MHGIVPGIRAVSIHAPYAGSDKSPHDIPGFCIRFQSTPPMQGATAHHRKEQHGYPVSIHAPYAGSDAIRQKKLLSLQVSIHAPYAGSDGANKTRPFFAYGFQSTPPMQGATQVIHIVTNKIIVSIHAPYAGSDAALAPRRDPITGFQSTPPMQGATSYGDLSDVSEVVSIHAPYAGSDKSGNITWSEQSRFQSTPPMQGATLPAEALSDYDIGFNPRPLCRERRKRR